MTAALTDERRAQLEARLAWLDGAVERHELSQRRAPWFLLGTIACIPVGIVWGAAIAFYVMIVSLAMTGVVFYVAWNHASECREEQDAIEVMLAGGAAALAEAADASAGKTAISGTADEARTGQERDRQRAQHDRYRRPRSV